VFASRVRSITLNLKYAATLSDDHLCNIYGWDSSEPLIQEGLDGLRTAAKETDWSSSVSSEYYHGEKGTDAPYALAIRIEDSRGTTTTTMKVDLSK